MKILMFNYEYPPVGGGGGVVHSLIAEELAKVHRVCVVTSAYGHLPRRQVFNGVEIRRVPVLSRSDAAVGSMASLFSYPPAAWLEAGRLLRHERFDVINSHFAVPTGAGSLPLAKLANIPHVVSLHGGDLFNPANRLSPHRLPGVRWVVGAVLRNSDAVVAQSTDTRDNAYRFFNYRGPITVIPHGIRRPEVPPATREELDLPADAFLAVTVGRLVRRKAVDRLLAVLARPECSLVHLAVVGTGPELNYLESLAGRLGVRDRVFFTGYVEETRKWQILQAADVYVSSTVHEGFGLVYLEAMTVGLPVVSTDCGGQTDFLRDGETGYLVHPGDEAGLAAALARVLADSEATSRIRHMNRLRAVQYGLERCARAYESLFESLADRSVESKSRRTGGRTPAERPAERIAASG